MKECVAAVAPHTSFTFQKNKLRASRTRVVWLRQIEVFSNPLKLPDTHTHAHTHTQVYPTGKMSKHIGELNVGDTLEVWLFCLCICRVGQNHTFIGIYGVHTVFLAGGMTIHTVIYGADIRFWPTLCICIAYL